MPRANKSCSCVGCSAHHGGCPDVVPIGTGRCATCARRADRARGTATQRGYGGKTWDGIRTAFLARPENQVCAIRGPRCTAKATVPDHWPDSRKDLLAQGVSDPDAFHRLRPACGPCHSSATARTAGQQGGWNAR